MTQEEFIQKAKLKHGDKYDYSKVEYVNNKTKVTIICQAHGEFQQVAGCHLQGNGCPKCGDNYMNKEYFIEKSKKIHSDKYDYSKVIYTGIKNKVIIVCPEHGEFEQSPVTHLQGSGCQECAGVKRLNNKSFIEKAKEVHGNKYDYSKVNYMNTRSKITIICPEHGEFEQDINNHLKGNGCHKCNVYEKYNTYEKLFIEKAKEVHNNKYDYSKVIYTGIKNKVIIVCPEHGEFEQNAGSHLQGKGCSKCSGRFMNTEYFIEKSKKIHGVKYDYSKVNYINTSTKICIICKEHGEFEQSPNEHLQGKGCSKCSGRFMNTEYFIEKSKKIHGVKYDYSKVNYINSKEKIVIICPVHGEFEQIPSSHLRGFGCSVCNMGFTKKYKLNLLSTLSDADLLLMDSIELMTIIKQGSLPSEFMKLVDSDSNSDSRLKTIKELKELFSNSEENENTETGDEEYKIVRPEFKVIEQQNEVDEEVTNTISEEVKKELPELSSIDSFKFLDREMYASMDEKAFNFLIEYQLRKLWNKVLNNEKLVDDIKNSDGGKYFNIIKEKFLEEYNVVSQYEAPAGYKFKFKPNLMQKLTVNRLKSNKYYGNWSGTGAGKTLSFIISSRELDSKLTLVIALNSTVEQLCNSIKEVYEDSVTYTTYEKDFVFDRTKNNYLVLNYEKFQQNYSEELFQNLTNNNLIDFIVLDEVHNAKKSGEDESIRRGVMTRLTERARVNNDNLHVMAMSATPVINNMKEAKSLLQLLTGLEYDNIKERKTLENATEIFRELTLNGLRFIPNYDINESELTGSNMSNLDIDGSHLIDSLLNISPSRYFDIERVLLDDKLKAIKPYLRKGVIIYTQFVDGIVPVIKKFVKDSGFKVATYTGESDNVFRDATLQAFINGDVDILIGSKPIGTGVDGLQKVCNRAIMMTLPWTDADYQQFKGRIYRQGSIFSDIEIVIPQIRIKLEDGNIWSWDVQRLNMIKKKRTLADACVDGLMPSKMLPTPKTMFQRAQESLEKWKDRVSNGNLIEDANKKIVIDLYPETTKEERESKINSELKEFNRLGKITHSSKMHSEFVSNPDSWFRYHALRKSRMEKWEEIPYEFIASKIKNKKHVVVDFGCGENKMKNLLPNKVISFDHVAVDDSVIACDMRDISEYVSNESVDVCVFSLALWGNNYNDYIKESYRVLNYGGFIYIAEPTSSYENIDELKTLITSNGFSIVGDIENRGKFTYVIGTKA